MPRELTNEMVAPFAGGQLEFRITAGKRQGIFQGEIKTIAVSEVEPRTLTVTFEWLVRLSPRSERVGDIPLEYRVNASGVVFQALNGRLFFMSGESVSHKFYPPGDPVLIDPATFRAPRPE